MSGILSIKVPMRGRRTDSPQGNVWMSPQRDIAYAFEPYVSKALWLLVNDKSHPDCMRFYMWAGEFSDLHVSNLRNALAETVRLRRSPETFNTLDLFQTLDLGGYYKLPEESQRVFNALLTRIVWSAWFAGTAHVLTGSVKPEFLGDLEDQTLEMQNGKPAHTSGWKFQVRRWLWWLLRTIG